MNNSFPVENLTISFLQCVNETLKCDLTLKNKELEIVENSRKPPKSAVLVILSCSGA